MNFYTFHIGDYTSATGHLSWDEDMAYRRLIEAYYIREEPIPLEPRAVYRLARASTEEQRHAVDVVLSEFFQRTDRGFVHHRCEEEIAAARAKKERASENANKRWKNAVASKSDAVALKNDAKAWEKRCEGNAPNKTLSYSDRPISNQHHPDRPVSTAESQAKLTIDEVDKILRAIPGLDAHPVATTPSIAPIWRLISAGLDFKTQILPSIKTQLAKTGKRQAIRSWNYFVPGIEADVQPATLSASFAVTDDEWLKRLAAGRQTKLWQTGRYGPMPGNSGCRVPAHLLTAEDGSGWQEWKPAA